MSSSVLSALGTASKIDISKLSKDLAEVSVSGQKKQANSALSKASAAISGFATLKRELSIFNSTLEPLLDKQDIGWKAISTNTSISVSTDKNIKIQPFSAKISVEQIAKNQVLGSKAIESTTKFGAGTIEISFGAYNEGKVFSPDAKQLPLIIEITEGANTLDAIAQKISSASDNIKASVIKTNEGSVLKINGVSGKDNGFQITIQGNTQNSDSTANSLSELSTGGLYALSNQQNSQDANILLDGIKITSATNKFDNIVQGIGIDISASKNGDETVINVEHDKKQLKSALTIIVESYNMLHKKITALVDNGIKSGVVGSLVNDKVQILILQRKLREFTTEPLAGLHPTQSITLSELGVKTGKNGELSLDTALMDKTIAGRYDIASGVFRNGIVTSSEMIEVVSSGQAKTGYYDIAVTRQPISGYAKTKDLSSLTFPLVTATDMTFKMRVDSVQSGDITLSSGTYDTLSTLKTAFQKAIVSDSVFRGAGIRPTVSISNGALSFQSPSYGTRSHVEFSALNSDLETLLGFSTENGGKNDVGVNIAGTINGETAVGSGRKLIGSTGGKTEGLSILVKLGVDSGSVYFAQSLPDRMKNFIDTFMDTDGSLENRISALTEKKKDLNTELTDLDAEMENIRKRYLKDFVKMDDLVRKLNSTSDLIKSQVKAWNNSSD